MKAVEFDSAPSPAQQINSYEQSEAERLRDLGNQAFRKGNYTEAIHHYRFETSSYILF